MKKLSIAICHMKMMLEDGTVAEDTTVHDRPIQLILGNQTLSEAFEKEIKLRKQGIKFLSG